LETRKVRLSAESATPVSKCFVVFIALLCAAQIHAADKIRVVATLTDLADLARNVGGEHVEVFSLATGIEDTHGVPMKPSFVPVLNRADLVVNVGFGCEHAFCPRFSKRAKIRASRMAIPATWIVQWGSRRWMCRSQPTIPKAMCIPTAIRITCSTGAGKTAVQNIYNALVATAPQYEADFRANRDAYLAKLDAKIAEWLQLAAPLKA